ncbi:MerR family transcriptional regulator [Pontibacter sp. G13]|uniref:MerR family transcriptional regulator n=1 Tax=Pontibacter sp. G13 TaxID=3074898 RepID=UPI00288C2119|nr:MerR family transcriptional regulator [Pontibacter sp. G13]WNJ17923.1 MerR family transcriptional regulator [Pontibacter sp. G13]
MRIGEIVSRTGVSKDTIRLYERMGLLGPVAQPHPYNNYKSYQPSHVHRVETIKQLKQFGFTLRECGHIIDTLVEAGVTEETKDEVIGKKLAEVEVQIAELMQLRDKLKAMVESPCTESEVARGNQLRTDLSAERDLQV